MLWIELQCASPSESGGSDAGETAVAGQSESGGASNHGGSSAGGASGFGGTSGHAGSVSESGASGVGEPSEAGSGGLGGADLGTAGSSDTAGNAGNAGDCTAVAWFPDADGDGFGRASGQVLSCDPPAVGKWVTKAGDCDDDNKAVFPKESDFEASGYTATSTGLSFDYDCSNQEETDPSQLGAAPACGGLSLLSCAGSGFASTPVFAARPRRPASSV